MKAPQTVAPNRKLILHFDVEDVLQLKAHDKEFFVNDLCAQWMWGKLERTSKEDAEKVTGWRLQATSLSVEAPEADLITYKHYLTEHQKSSPQEYEKIMLGLSKGAGAKVKGQIEKIIKNITVPKALFEALKEAGVQESALLRSYLKDGKYVILPAFYKLLMTLKKSKRQFAIVIKGTKQSPADILAELNAFFVGEHPLFNGKNGTPQVRMDGSKGVKNYVLDDVHQTVVYCLGQAEFYSSYGTLQYFEEKDLELFKQKFKSLKTVKLCSGANQIYSFGHAILTESGCIYEVNPEGLIFIDPVDYLTQEIYFTSRSSLQVYSCLGERITETSHIAVRVNMFDYLKDVDYFSKALEGLEAARLTEIERIQKGNPAKEEPEEKQSEAQTDGEYLRRNLLPILEGALKQVDLFRPEDPLGFIALYCLKNKHRIE